MKNILPRLIPYPNHFNWFFAIVMLFVSNTNAQTIRCNDFLDNVGVSGANNWNNFNNANVNFFYQKANDLGVRFFRTGEWLGSDPSSYGLKVTFSSGKDKKFKNLNNLQANINLAKNYGSSLAVIEGPNEPDPDSSKAEIRNWQEALWNNVSSDPSLSGVKVSGPAMAHSFGYTKIGRLDQWSDYANCHPYTWSISELQPRLDNWISRSELTHPGQIKMATEMGTHNKISEGGVSPAADAIYITRSYLYLYKLGFRYIANFRFADNDPNFEGGRNWGMLDSNLNETPQYKSLKNFLSLIQDNQSNFTKKTLDYSLSGVGSDDLEQVVMQHSDGRFFLILWQPVDSFDDVNNDLTNPPSKGITITLTNKAKKIRTFKPSDPSRLDNGTNALKTYVNLKSFQVQVNDHILVIEITPTSFPNPNKWYTFQNKDNDLYMRNEDCGTAYDTKLELFDGTGDCAQWRFIKNGDAWTIKNRRSGLNIRHDGSSVVSDSTLAELINTTGDRTEFYIVPSPTPGYYNLQHKGSLLYLRNNDCQDVSDQTLIEFFDGNGECAQWKIEEVGDVNTNETLSSPSVSYQVKNGNKLQKSFKVYPNPVKNSLNVEGVEGTLIILYDMSGKEVLKNKTSPVDVSKLPRGVYFVKVGSFVTKVLIK